MTRKLSRNPPLSIVASFVAILTLLIAAAVLAQVTDADRLSGKANSVSAQLRAAPAQAERPSMLGSDGAGRFPVVRSQTKRHRMVPMDSTPPLFQPAVVYDSGGSNATSVAVADLNGEGKPDLVVTNLCANGGCINGEGVVAVLLGNGDGTFKAAVIDGSGVFPESVAIGDVNGDGKPDLVVTQCPNLSCQGNGSVAVLLGIGDGTFRPAVNYDSGGYLAWSVVVGDVNGDGKPDLLVANCASSGLSCGDATGAVSILLGNGDGTFQPAVTYGSGGIFADSIAIADVNGDGKPDLVVANQCVIAGCGTNSGGVAVLLGNGDGTFRPAVTYDSGGIAFSVAIADVNGDGKPDLVVANLCANFNNCGTGTVGVLLGNGDGTFQPTTNYASDVNQYRSVAVADVNGNGKADLLVAGYDATSTQGIVDVWLGKSDGSFQLGGSFDTGGFGADSIAVADVNGDGRRDLLIANDSGIGIHGGNGTIGVLLNNTGPHSPTTTTLVSAPNPSVFGQLVSFTAVVSSSSGTPTGMVALFEGSVALGSATLTNGTASIPDSSLAAGSHSITAVYQGSTTFSPSTSGPLIQVVNTAKTTTALASSANPARVNQTVTYTATVTSQYGEVATGTAKFRDGGVTVATVPLANNQAAYSATYPQGGSHAMTAAYSGDANNRRSTSPTLMEYVPTVASKTVVTTSGSPSVVGQPVTFTATVTSRKGVISDGELVTFYDGKTTLGSAPLMDGTATFTTSTLLGERHSIKATYAGDATFVPSTGWVRQVVDKYPTTTALVSSSNPSSYGQAVTFTARVTPTGPYALTGTVRFWDGTISIGSATLSGEVATLTKSKLAVGTHPITAQYLGDATLSKSTSPVLNQVVK